MICCRYCAISKLTLCLGTALYIYLLCKFLKTSIPGSSITAIDCVAGKKKGEKEGKEKERKIIKINIYYECKVFHLWNTKINKSFIFIFLYKNLPPFVCQGSVFLSSHCWYVALHWAVTLRPLLLHRNNEELFFEKYSVSWRTHWGMSSLTCQYHMQDL